MWLFKKKPTESIKQYVNIPTSTKKILTEAEIEDRQKKLEADFEARRAAEMAWAEMNSYEEKVKKYNRYVNIPFKYPLGLEIQGWKVIETIKDVMDIRCSIYHIYEDTYSVMHMASGRIEKVDAKFIDILVKVPNNIK